MTCASVECVVSSMSRNIGFWGVLYYNYKKEPPSKKKNSVGNSPGPKGYLSSVPAEHLIRPQSHADPSIGIKAPSREGRAGSRPRGWLSHGLVVFHSDAIQVLNPFWAELRDPLLDQRFAIASTVLDLCMTAKTTRTTPKSRTQRRRRRRRRRQQRQRPTTTAPASAMLKPRLS